MSEKIENTTSTTRTVQNVTMNGYKVDKNLNMDSNAWSKLTESQRKEFSEKRKQYQKTNLLPYVPQNNNNNNNNYNISCFTFDYIPLGLLLK